MSTDKGDAASEPKGAKALEWIVAAGVHYQGHGRGGHASALADLRALITERDGLRERVAALEAATVEAGTTDNTALILLREKANAYAASVVAAMHESIGQAAALREALAAAYVWLVATNGRMAYDDSSHPEARANIARDLELVRAAIDSTAAAVAAYRERVRAEVLEKAVRALCRDCKPTHVLDNGRVWGLCRAVPLIDAFGEDAVAKAVRSLRADATTDPGG